MASTNNISKKRKVERDEVEQQEEVENTADYADGQSHLYQQEDSPGDKPASATEGDDEEEDVDDLLEPLSREQLVTIIRSAALSNPNTLDEIRRLADLDPSHRKIFVHGLSWGTDSDALRSFFSQFGEIDDCKVVTDRSTGKSKGFGFVLFQHRSSARNALKNPQKQIDGRMTACQLASIGPTAGSMPSQQRGHSSPVHYQQQPQQQHRHQQQQAPPSDKLARKIYVGNVHADIDGNRLLDFFSRYGEVEEGPLGFDRHTGRPKGFALFIYRTVEGARKALEEPNKNFDGHLLYCQKSTDSSGHKKQQSVSGASPANPSGNSAVQGGGGGYNMPSAASAYNLQGNTGNFNASMDMGLAQGMLSGAMPFGQGMPANAAAFAMLAAQNPAAFGVSPALLAQFNPALAAAMSAGAPQMAMQTQVGDQGYGMANTAAYQNAAYQGTQQPIGQTGVTYQSTLPVGQASSARPPMGGMGGYASH